MYVFIIYIYIYITYANILANPTHMHHTKHVFCVPLHYMQGSVPLHPNARQQKAISCIHGYLHGSMGENALHSPLHVHGTPSHMH